MPRISNRLRIVFGIAAGVVFYVLGFAMYADDRTRAMLSGGDSGEAFAADEPSQTPAAKSESGTAFTILPSDSRGRGYIHVFASRDGTRYQADVSVGPSRGSWKLISLPPMFCFKKDTYKYMYCVHERLVPVGIIGYGGAPSLFLSETIPEDLPEAEEELRNRLPGDPVMCRMLIEAALLHVRRGDLQDNRSLIVQVNDDRWSEVGTVQHVRMIEDSVTVPPDAFDVMRFLHLLEASGLRSVDRHHKFWDMEQDDEHFIQNITEGHLLSMDDFLITSGPLRPETIHNIRREGTMDELANALESYRLDHHGYPVTDDLAVLERELSTHLPVLLIDHGRPERPYLPALPSDNGGYYFSYKSPDGRDYVITYTLVNGDTRTVTSHRTVPKSP